MGRVGVAVIAVVVVVVLLVMIRVGMAVEMMAGVVVLVVVIVVVVVVLVMVVDIVMGVVVVVATVVAMWWRYWRRHNHRSFFFPPSVFLDRYLVLPGLRLAMRCALFDRLMSFHKLLFLPWHVLVGPLFHVSPFPSLLFPLTHCLPSGMNWLPGKVEYKTSLQ